MYCWQQGTLLLRDAGKEQVGYHSWIQEGKSTLMTRRRNCGYRGCGMVLGLIVILLSVSVLEDEQYEEFLGGAVLVWCESWSPRCSGEPLHQGGSLDRLLGQPVVSFRGS